MSDNPQTVTDQQLLQLNAAIGNAARATGSVDMGLVMLLGDIIHPGPLAGQDMALASCIVFSQNTIERRFDIVRKILTQRLGYCLDRPTHEYSHKLAKFLLKAFNMTAETLTKNMWIRNAAAHGSIVSTNPPTLIPSPFDFEGAERFRAKRGGNSPTVFESGFTAEELNAFTREPKAVHRRLMQINAIMQQLLRRTDNRELEKLVVELGAGLKIPAPLQARPPRKARQPRAPT